MATPQPTSLPSDAAPVRSLDPLGLELRRPGEDLWAAILPNPSHPAMPYKVQYFASFGFAGHQVHATPQAALADALADGFTEPDRGALQRWSQTPAWRAAYNTPTAPLALARQRVERALAVLARCGATVETITLGRGAVAPRIVIRGPAPKLPWRCYAWGCDARGRYRRFAAALAGCQLVREVRDGPRGPYRR